MGKSGKRNGKLVEPKANERTNSASHANVIPFDEPKRGVLLVGNGTCCRTRVKPTAT